ncbi:hypothetical protein [Campylobacter sputorum]|uniref:hypothetical protein n=1 Tax=Campylobacter sputorum TaxID=206 RepID=UPI001E38C43A|nr:hypothetical protein [Campylobacter sputorum]
MSNNFFNAFHKVILSFFLLILFAACGYKAPPFYSADSSNDVNKTNENFISNHDTITK